MSLGEISSQIIEDERQKKHLKNKAEHKRRRAEALQQRNLNKNDTSSDESESEGHKDDDNDKPIGRVEEIIRFSDNDDDEESEDEDGVDNGGSIWANAADIFNPAKRANFIQ